MGVVQSKNILRLADRWLLYIYMYLGAEYIIGYMGMIIAVHTLELGHE